MRSSPGAGRGRHLVLLGPPGAGKSTIGPLVADALGRRFVDLDAEIARRSGRSVMAIVAAEGEGAFRALERRLSADLLRSDGPLLVLAPGGGWVEDAENRALLGARADGIYLQVSVAVALARMGASVETRPLLAGGDPAQKLGELIRRREAFYLQARYTVSNESMSPSEAASSIVALATAERPD